MEENKYFLLKKWASVHINLKVKNSTNDNGGKSCKTQLKFQNSISC